MCYSVQDEGLVEEATYTSIADRPLPHPPPMDYRTPLHGHHPPPVSSSGAYSPADHKRYDGMCYEDIPGHGAGVSDIEVDRDVAYAIHTKPKIISADDQDSRLDCRGRGEGGSSGRCCSWTCAIGLLAAISLVVAVGALGLVLVDFFGVVDESANPAPVLQPNVSSAGPSAGPPPDSDNTTALAIAELSSQISELQEGLLAARKTIQELEDGLRVLGQELNHSISFTSSQIQELSLQLETLNTTAFTNSAPADTSLPASSYPALLYNLSMYQNCSTSRDADCTVSTVGLGDPPYSVCETGSVPIKAEGLHTQDAVCVVTNRNGEGNPVVTSLDVNTDSNTMKCRCFVIALSQRAAPVSCALSVTRCPETDNYSTDVMRT